MPRNRNNPDAFTADAEVADHRLSAPEVLKLVAAERGPVPWRRLQDLTDSREPTRRKALRSLLRRMLDNGELSEDNQGRYRVGRGAGTVDTGVVERQGRNLTFNGVAIERMRDMHLRPGDRVEATLQGDRVQILRVVDYSPQPLVGELKGRGRQCYVESLSPDYKGRVSLEVPPTHGDPGNSVEVRITGEDRRGLVGVVEAVISTSDGVAHAAETLLESYAVPRVWPEGVEEAAAKLPKHVQPARHKDRRSLEAMPLVTIDGATAKDFDDAVFAEPDGDGWRLVVAIADVAHYVKPGSALDRSAWERGNSLYLPDRVIPMLPEALSNGLCSLRPHEPRLALVCDMRISPQGRVTGFEFYEAVIRSWQRLTYSRVQEFLDAGALDVEADVQDSLRQLKAVYFALRDARKERGALDFDSHDAVIELKDGRIHAIHPVTRLDAHRLIEEAMISANVCAAQYLEDQDRGALYRIHEPPTGEKSEQLRQALGFAGVRLAKGDATPKAVHTALEQLGDRPDRWIFEMLALRTMNQALYSPTNKGHYGLALERYMHFTSPIRRYADLVVHRAIKASLQGKSSGMSDDWLATTGDHISVTERRAESVSWGVDSWLKCEYIAERIGETFDGVVMGVTEFGLFVEVTGFYVQGLVHISELGQDYFQLSSSGMALVGEKSGRRYALGDSLRVRLVDVQPPVGKVDLVVAGAPPASDGAEAVAGDAKPGKSGRSGRGGRSRKVGAAK